MSEGRKVAYKVAVDFAAEVVEKLTPHCERIAIAGSLRRQRAQIGDIEIVALPRRAVDLFGQADLKRPSALDEFLKEKGVQLAKDGPLYKQFRYGGLNVDLFLPASAAHWGCIYTIRTGSHEFNLWLMNVASPRAGVRFESGRLLRRLSGVALDTPEEVDVFTALRLPFITPQMRDDNRWLEVEGVRP